MIPKSIKGGNKVKKVRNVNRVKFFKIGVTAICLVICQSILFSIIFKGGVVSLVGLMGKGLFVNFVNGLLSSVIYLLLIFTPYIVYKNEDRLSSYNQSKFLFNYIRTKEFVLIQGINFVKVVKEICVIPTKIGLLIILLSIGQVNLDYMPGIVPVYCVSMALIYFYRAIAVSFVSSNKHSTLEYLLGSFLWFIFSVVNYKNSFLNFEDSVIGKLFVIAASVVILTLLIEKSSMWLIKKLVFSEYASAKGVSRITVKEENQLQKISVSKKWEPYIAECSKNLINNSGYITTTNAIGECLTLEIQEEHLKVVFRLKYINMEFEFDYPFEREFLLDLRISESGGAEIDGIKKDPSKLIYVDGNNLGELYSKNN